MKDEKNITEEVRTLGALLRLPYQALQREVYGELGGLYPEIRPAHSAVFRHILPGGSRVTDLAERAGMTKQSMAYLVEGLEAGGFVSTEPDPSDRRAKRVRLTPRGREVQEAAAAISRRVEEEWGQRIGRKRIRDLRAALEAFCETLERSG